MKYSTPLLAVMAASVTNAQVFDFPQIDEIEVPQIDEINVSIDLGLSLSLPTSLNFEFEFSLDLSGADLSADLSLDLSNLDLSNLDLSTASIDLELASFSFDDLIDEVDMIDDGDVPDVDVEFDDIDVPEVDEVDVPDVNLDDIIEQDDSESDSVEEQPVGVAPPPPEEEPVETPSPTFVVEVVKIEATMKMVGYSVATFTEGAQNAFKNSIASLGGVDPSYVEITSVTDVTARRNARMLAGSSIDIQYEIFSDDEDADMEFFEEVHAKLAVVDSTVFASEYEEAIVEEGEELPADFAVEEIVFEEPAEVEHVYTPEPVTEEEEEEDDDVEATSSANKKMQFFSAVFIVTLSTYAFCLV